MAHADHTYDAHPLLPRTRVAALRGGGIELRVHDVDPDAAVAAARARRLRGARAPERQAARPARGLHPRRATATSGSRTRACTLEQVERTCDRTGEARARTRDSLACPSAWAAIRSTSPTRAPRARTRRRPRAASTRRRASRRSRRSTSSPRRSSQARSTAACSRSRTRSPGSCPDTLAILEEGAVSVVAEVALHIPHCLVGPAGATLETVRVVHSHPMALAQCRNALNGRYERVAASTTSEAARTVAALGDVTVAAIASPLAARSHGLAILAEEISDHPENLTRFVVAGALHAARPRRPHRVAHRAPADHQARARRAAQRRSSRCATTTCR